MAGATPTPIEDWTPDQRAKVDAAFRSAAARRARHLAAEHAATEGEAS